MEGRKIFKKYSSLLNVLVFFFEKIPNKFKKKLWNFIQGYHGKISIGLRYCILKSSLKSCGNNVFIGPFVEVKNWENLIIGDNVSIQSNCYIEAIGGVTIGNNVSIAQASSIFSVNHTWENSQLPIKYNELKFQKVNISNDVWIGSGCRILGGVKIAQRNIIGAGAVVTKDTEENSLYCGVPAKKIKSLINISIEEKNYL